MLDEFPYVHFILVVECADTFRVHRKAPCDGLQAPTLNAARKIGWFGEREGAADLLRARDIRDQEKN
jgi:hypothetical protein